MPGRPPGEIIVEVLTHLAVQSLGVVGALTLTMHLKRVDTIDLKYIT